MLTFFRSLFATQVDIPWVVYYSDKASLDVFDPYDVVVLDRFYHPPIHPLVKEKKKVFGYVTLGEVESHAPWFEKLKKEGIVLVENENWPGSFLIDMRSYKWRETLIKEIIPYTLEKGFNGLFLDTIDNAIFLETLDPAKYAGMVNGAVQLIKEIRFNFPDILIMLNRGLDLLDDVAPFIHYFLIEDLFTSYDFQDKHYFIQNESVLKGVLATIEEVKADNPKLVLLSLDYWDPEDKKTVAELYEKARKAGFSPYVSTIDLKEVYPEPSPQ